MAFASSRGWHRLACAIEDAGFVIHPSIFGWGTGQGFPKATRIDTQVDKAAGAEREIVGKSDRHPGKTSNTGGVPDFVRYGAAGDVITAPATPLARAWVGHRYGLQALKPALEPIIVAQKPYAGKPVECITRTGAGALWVDGGRVAGHVPCTIQGQSSHAGEIYGADQRNQRQFAPHTLGRWPANLVLDDAGAAAIDAQSGDCRSSGMFKRGDSVPQGGAANFPLSGGTAQYNDTGGSSRFFQRIAEQIDDADPVRYVAKASRRERDAGLQGMPYAASHAAYGDYNGTPEHGPNTNGKQRNSHPTVKPLALTRYLATLLLPPAEYAPRRLFVPFAGAGSECVGAMQAGWDEVVGVEMMNDAEHNYVELARARVAYWASKEPML
jgi:site-specific DNA-methyltransferase (adenine-specific)